MLDHLKTTLSQLTAVQTAIFAVAVLGLLILGLILAPGPFLAAIVILSVLAVFLAMIIRS